MSLFDRQTPEDQARQKRQEQSRAQLERGGLPLDAEQRLRDLAGRAEFFTSNLSVNEFVLASHARLRPLGAVTGVSVFLQREPDCAAGSSRELKGVGSAEGGACRRALKRLSDAAHRMGAHGVVGVRLERRERHWRDRFGEWAATGTAVALGPDSPPARPWVCALPVQDFHALTAAGYAPLGIVLGVICYHQQAHLRVEQRVRSGWLGTNLGAPNVERTDCTRGLYAARRNALGRLEDEAAALGASGVLALRVTTEVTPCPRAGGYLIRLTALGTAVTAAPGGPGFAIDYALPLTG